MVDFADGCAYTSQLPPYRDGTGWRRLDRWLSGRSHRRAVALYERYAAEPPAAPGWAAGRVAAAALGVTVRLALALCLILGGWLCVRRFPGLTLIPGLILCGVAVLLWPRAPRISRYATALDRAETPDLYALAARIAAAVGAPAPHVIHVDDRLGADAVTRGLLWRRHLVLGIPLLAALTPPRRVALLAVQLARFGTTDLLHGPVVGGIDVTLDALTAALTPGPSRTPRAAQDTRIVEAGLITGGAGRLSVGSVGGLVWISELVWMPIAAVLRGGLALLRLGVAVLVRPTAHRAECFSDSVAATVAGTALTVDVLDVMLSAEALVPRLRTLARARTSTAAWPDAAEQVLADADARARRRRFSARREISPLGTRLPLGLRAAMLASRPDTPAVLTLDDAGNRRIDESLANHYRRSARDLANGSPLG